MCSLRKVFVLCVGLGCFYVATEPASARDSIGICEEYNIEWLEFSESWGECDPEEESEELENPLPGEEIEEELPPLPPVIGGGNESATSSDSSCTDEPQLINVCSPDGESEVYCGCIRTDTNGESHFYNPKEISELSCQNSSMGGSSSSWDLEQGFSSSQSSAGPSYTRCYLGLSDPELEASCWENLGSYLEQLYADTYVERMEAYKKISECFNNASNNCSTGEVLDTIKEACDSTFPKNGSETVTVTINGEESTLPITHDLCLPLSNTMG